ncbi:type IV pilus modification PilV family protein [Oceanithermus sp.]
MKQVGRAGTGGFSLIEVLTSLLILGIISLAFIRIFSTTLDATGRINDRNTLLHEAQLAEQIIASRVKLAWEVFPPGTSIRINNGATTRNHLAGSNTWVVGSDPMLALVLPPKKPGYTERCDTSNPDFCFRFFAYYAFRRSDYLSAVSPTSAEALFPDSQNDDTWVIMEFRRVLTNVTDPSTIAPPNGDSIYAGVKGRLLVEYVQPETDSPAYSLFTVNPDKSVDVALRMIRHTSKRDYRAPKASEPPLTIRVVPRNLGVGN